MAFGAIGQIWVILMSIIVIADIYGVYPLLTFAMYVFHIVLLAAAISLSLYKWQKWRYTVRVILIQEILLAALVEILLFREGIVLGAIVLNTMLLILYEVALRRRYPDMKFLGFKKKNVNETEQETGQSGDGSPDCLRNTGNSSSS